MGLGYNIDCSATAPTKEVPKFPDSNCIGKSLDECLILKTGSPLISYKIESNWKNTLVRDTFNQVFIQVLKHWTEWTWI